MSAEKKVFKALFKVEEKVELSIHKIDFAILSSLEKELDKIYNDINRSEVILNKSGNDVESISKNILLKVGNANENLDKAEEMAKDLGVQVPEISNLKGRLLKAESAGKQLLKRSKSVQ